MDRKFIIRLFISLLVNFTILVLILFVIKKGNGSVNTSLMATILTVLIAGMIATLVFLRRRKWYRKVF